MSHVGPLIGNVLDDEQLGDDVVDLTEGIETISNFIRKATKGKECKCPLCMYASVHVCM